MRKKILKITLSSFSFLLIAGCLAFWYVKVFPYVSSSCACVDANVFKIASVKNSKIVETFYKEGTVVKKGDLLAKLDSSIYEAKLDVLKAKLKEALNDLKYQKVKVNQAADKYSLARKDFEYYRSISHEELQKFYDYYEEKEIVHDSYLAKINVIEAKMRLMDKKIKSAFIYSPASGVISKSFRATGDLVEFKEPLCMLYENDNFWISASLNKHYVNNLKKDMDVKIKLDSCKDTFLSGKIVNIDPTEGKNFNLKNNKNIQVKISLEQQQNLNVNLIPGMSGQVGIKVR
jgi:multidrug resistance efflux pump